MRGATGARPCVRDRRGISIHAPHAGCDRHEEQPNRHNRNFNPRTPCGVRRGGGETWGASPPDFNPRTPCGVRLKRRKARAFRLSFQSTHPMRGATGCSPTPKQKKEVFQSTHPMRGATVLTYTKAKKGGISIHAPHAGCDCPDGHVVKSKAISIHAPHAGCDLGIWKVLSLLVLFQSTHPMRGATRVGVER